MDKKALQQLKNYQITVIFSVLFALVGFSYNVWRMEASEHNSNVRTASFEILLKLAELEQLVYSARYDNDKLASPRKGWVLVGLIHDLSSLTDDAVLAQAGKLKSVWADHWSQMASSQQSTDSIVAAIDVTRTAITRLLASLK